MSNLCCLPGRAGGSPGYARTKANRRPIVAAGAVCDIDQRRLARINSTVIIARMHRRGRVDASVTRIPRTQETAARGQRQASSQTLSAARTRRMSRQLNLRDFERAVLNGMREELKDPRLKPTLAIAMESDSVWQRVRHPRVQSSRRSGLPRPWPD